MQWKAVASPRNPSAERGGWMEGWGELSSIAYWLPQDLGHQCSGPHTLPFASACSHGIFFSNASVPLGESQCWCHFLSPHILFFHL